MAEGFVPTKDNVWSCHYIEDFQQMISNHHRSLHSFQRVGSMLETSGQIYGIKVDSLHGDVLRLSSGIRRQSTVSESVDDIISEMSTVRYVRRQRPTVHGNAEAINAPLQTIEQPSGCLAMQTDVSAKNLLQNVLPSHKYVLSLQTKNKLWIERDARASIAMDDESMILDGDSVDIGTSNWIPSSNDVLRPRLTGYTISNAPCEHFHYPETATNANLLGLEDNEIAAALSLDFQFDIDAAVPVGEPDVMIPDAIAASFIDQDDRNVLRRCSALQLSTAIIDDMRPLSCSPLQYSYRRLTDDSLPNGPSHWKIPSEQNTSEKGKKKKRKIANKDKPVDFQIEPSENVEQKFINVDDRRVVSIRKSDRSKWNPAGLKTHSKMMHALAVIFAPLLMHSFENDLPDDGESNIDVTATVGANENRSIRLDESPNMNMDVGIDVADVEMQEISLVPVDHSMDCAMEVDAEVAPSDDVQQPRMPPFQLHQLMQVSPANINIKQISKRCLEIICDLEKTGGEVTFARIYYLLQDGNQEVITPAVVFSCILELANKNNFSLKKIDENNFVIKRP